METDPRMFGLHGVQYFVEVGTTEVRGCLETGEDTASGHSLEMFLTDVLQRSSQPNY